MIIRYAHREETATSETPPRTWDGPPPGSSAQTVRTVQIRPYRGQDRAAVRRICCETGFLGDPIDHLFQDHELFADLFTRPYLDHEPEWALVAESEGRVVGYLLGSVCKNFDFILLRSGFQTASKMFFRFLRGRYARHPRSEKFVRWLLTSGMREQPRHPPNAAHLHLDIEKSFRGHGLLGLRLWEVYETKLRAAGVQRCYGAFCSYGQRRPELVYARYGFTEFDRKRTTLFEPEVAEPVDVVCVLKEF